MKKLIKSFKNFVNSSKNNKKSRSLLMSAFSSIILLLSVTFAWFVSTINLGGNEISTGTLGFVAKGYDQNGNLKNYYPFVGILTNEEFLEFINSGNVKKFDEYCYVGNTKKTLDKQRMYVIGEYEIKKENSISSSL